MITRQDWDNSTVIKVWLAYIHKLQRMCGTYATARYLRRRGYSLNEALYALANGGARV